MSSEKTSKQLIPDIQVEMLKQLNFKEMDEVSEVARMDMVPFHVAYIRWKTKST